MPERPRLVAPAGRRTALPRRAAQAGRGPEGLRPMDSAGHRPAGSRSAATASGRGPRRWSAQRRARLLRTAVVLAVLLCSSIGILASSGGKPAPPRRHAALAAARTQPPDAAATVLAGPAEAVAAGVARDLFTAAPVVVVANPGNPASVRAAARSAASYHAPLLLAAPAPGGTPGGLLSAATRAEIRALHPRAVLAVGLPWAALAAGLRGLQVISDLARLPAVRAPAPLGQVALLVRRADTTAEAVAAAGTAWAAGARLIRVRGADPRADPADIAALAAARPRQVLALGAGFGPPAQLAARVAVAETGVQLPGGRQVLFPGHRLVTLYGHPGDPALGVLGQQGLAASIARAKRVAVQYRTLSSVPVVPALEIIATVAEGSPGPDGSYSYESPVAMLRPWVRRATAAGLYVVLDLQPGRASLLAQAQRYQPLLKLPDVGLALDPEWKLGPRQRPLRQIGSVGIGEVNSVVSWLGALTARNHLPQKLLALHQFRLSMIQGEQQLDTRHDNLAIVIHMDGQGTPGVKQQTWDAITRAAPAGVFFGWKDFYVKDHPMLDPRQTMTHRPQPVMISYQ
jgi:hypothetical protein